MNIKLVVFLSFPFTYEATNAQYIEGKKKKNTIVRNGCVNVTSFCFRLFLCFLIDETAEGP